MDFRLRSTGEVVSRPTLNQLYPDQNFAAVLTQDDFDTYGFDPVMPRDQPIITPFQYLTFGVELVGTEWFELWTIESLTGDALAAALEQNRALKLTEVNEECDNRLRTLVSSYPVYEVFTFQKQEYESRGFLNDAEFPTPMLTQLADKRGIDKTELANRIVAKADAFAAYAGKMIGYRQKLEDQLTVANATTILDIDPPTGWPE